MPISEVDSSFLDGVSGTGRENNDDDIFFNPENERAGQQEQFMSILLEQLKNQDPLEPLDNADFVQQITQLTSLEQLTKMNDTFAEFTRSARSNQFISLLGQDVNGITDTGQELTGEVERIKFNQDDTILVIGGQDISSDAIQEIGLAKTTDDD